VALAATLGWGGALTAPAQASADLDAITAQDLLRLLIDEGVIDASKAQALAQKLKTQQRAAAGAAVGVATLEQVDVRPSAEAGVVRVPYVPKYIRDEIRDQVRIGLKEDVSRDVLSQARQERWGVPGALPDWAERIRFSGDIRVREESTLYADDNVQGDYLDIAHINGRGNIGIDDPDIFRNITEDRHRLRARFRLGVKARVNNQFEVGARLATGNIADPVSTNQTLGNYGEKWQNNFDLAYLRYKSTEGQLQVAAGRIENPFFGSDLIWDSDLTFEGVAASWWMLRSTNLLNEFRTFDPFVTVGAFPIGEIDRSARDKWLYAAQAGFQYEFINQNKLTAALAWYAYDGIVGRRNALDDTALDFTAPDFIQKGNTLFDIRNNLDPASTSVLFAHAVDYRLANAYVEYDIANFAPIHVIVAADYVKNLGYDAGDVAGRLGFAIDERTQGYQGRLTVGWPQVTAPRSWQVSFIYRYLERDAVLDAFTDSDFHGGGTDAQGYILRFDYGLLDNVWLTMRWLSANEIDGDSFPQVTGFGAGKLGVDTLQIDLNAKF
jgi:hypothetical protein